MLQIHSIERDTLDCYLSNSRKLANGKKYQLHWIVLEFLYQSELLFLIFDYLVRVNVYK